jgi:hypothetical protein
VSEQFPPADRPFIPPPPPTSDSLYSAETLRLKADEIANDAKNALIMSLIGLLCFGMILGVLAFKKANAALENINIYQVGQDKRGLATTAKVIAIIDIIVWVAGIALRIALR